MQKIVEHNLECPMGYEIALELSMKQGEVIFESLANLESSVDVATMAGAYATCGLLNEGILIEFEEHLLSRLPQMDNKTVVWLLKTFV